MHKGKKSCMFIRNFLNSKKKSQVFENKTKSNVLFTINADKMDRIGLHQYKFTDSEGNYLGRVGRKGIGNPLESHYEVFDDNDKFDFKIQEEMVL